MIRRLGSLGLCLLAVATAYGVEIGSAQAAPARFTSTAGATIKAEDSGNIKLTITGQSVTCGKSVYTGTAPAPEFTSLTVHPSFSECITGIGTTATITGFGQHGEAKPCDVVLYAIGTADLVCPTGQEVTVDAATCIAHIPAQTGLWTFTYTNSGRHVDIGINLTNIASTHTDGFLCPFSSSGQSNIAGLESSSAATAKATVTSEGAGFTSSAGKTTIEAKDTSNVKLTVTGQSVTCNSAIFTGETPGASFTSITVNASYSECSGLILGYTATVTGFGQHGEEGKCDFVLYAIGEVDLVCPAGQEATIETGPCTVHIPAQKGLGSLAYTNNGKHIDIGINVTGITSNHTDGFLCPFGSTGHSTAGVLESVSALTMIPGVGSLSVEPGAPSPPSFGFDPPT